MNDPAVFPASPETSPGFASSLPAPPVSLARTPGSSPAFAAPESPEQEAAKKAALHYAMFERCWHFTPTGRRCRQRVHDPNTSLCRKHAKVERKLDRDGFVADLSPLLTANPRQLDDLEGVHSFLSSLAVLLAQNRISARRASVLSYICTQLIRTNIAIDQRAPDSCSPLAWGFPSPRDANSGGSLPSKI